MILNDYRGSSVITVQCIIVDCILSDGISFVERETTLFSQARTGFLTLVLLLVMVPCSYAVLGGEAGRTGPTGRYVVKLTADAKVDAIQTALTGSGRLRSATQLIVRDDLNRAEHWRRYYLYEPRDTSQGVAAISSLIGDDNIEYIEPEYWVEFFDYPDDSLFAHQWFLNNTGQEYMGIERVPGGHNDELVLKTGTPGKDINISPYYEVPPSETTAVVVAIVDSGSDLVHPELTGRLWRNPDEIPYNGIDDDRNGFIDDTLGYDVSGDSSAYFDPVGDNDPTDSVGHGTHLAGIVASTADQYGVVGVAPQTRLMTVKMYPNATTTVGAAGIVYAVNAGARIINVSWGTPFEAAILREALDFARANGVFVSIAVGNTGDNTRFFPAAFDGAFTVGAGNSDGFVTDFSTYGAHVDLIAPGLDILSLRAAGTDMYAVAGEPGIRIVDDDSLYYLSDGTSMAAPVVAGAAAAMLSWRPDLTLDELEELLREGATDLIDPWGDGQSLPGPDTISGFGDLNLAGSLEMMLQGGIVLVEPVLRNRYTTDLTIKAAAVGGYTGSWLLEYSIGSGSTDYQFLATGDELPTDSILFVFTDTTAEGFLNLRLTDKHGATSMTNCTYVRRRQLEITSPLSGTELQFSIPIIGNAYGPDYDSMAVYYRKLGEEINHLTSSFGEYFDSLLYGWSASGVDTGSFSFYLYGYYGAESLADTLDIRVISAFAEGWPISLSGYGAITPVLVDFGNDGTKELVVGTTNGLYAFDRYGGLVPGFPVMTGTNVRCVPAIYDTDGDGYMEIICTSDSMLHVIKQDGSAAPGWPQPCYTGRIPYGYGYPTPTVTRLGMHEDSAIVILNKRGEILAYEFDGTPYFYSLGGLFASFDPRISSGRAFGGSTSPFVTGYDITGDGINEVIASYAAPEPYSGLGVFVGRTGQPAFDRDNPLTQFMPDVLGSALADLDGDMVPEVITVGKDNNSIPTVWVKKEGLYDSPGWPISMPSSQNWIGSYPTVADLDLDGTPEILITFFEYDIARLFIFRSDGTSYVSDLERPEGEAYSRNVTFGTPIVANLTGDEYPEIIFRSGFVLPGTGNEMVHILDYQAEPLPGWPIVTPTRPNQVFSSRYAPLVDDLDGDGLVELILVSDGPAILVWDFDAESNNGANTGRFLIDNLNSGVLPPSSSMPPAAADINYPPVSSKPER